MSRALFALMGMMLIFAASANQIWDVCPEGCQCAGIQDAVGLAAGGDTIRVFGGAYTGDLNIDRPLIVRGKGDGNGLPVVEAYRLSIAPGTTVREIDFRPGSGGTMVIQSSNASIFLNDFTGRECVRCLDNNTWSSGKQINYRYNGKVFLGQMGNYWADYRGVDANGNGIGDDPFVIDEMNTDHYPLMEPVEVYGIEGEGIFSEGGVVAALGVPFEISLKAKPGSGFQWMADYDFHILRLDGERMEDGADPRAVFTFTPLLAGKTEVAFVYKRSWENIIKDCRRFEVKIQG